MQKAENPGLQPRASRDLCRPLHTQSLITVLDRQAQLIARRFSLAPGIARALAGHCFGGARDD